MLPAGVSHPVASVRLRTVAALEKAGDVARLRQLGRDIDEQVWTQVALARLGAAAAPALLERVLATDRYDRLAAAREILKHTLRHPQAVETAIALAIGDYGCNIEADARELPATLAPVTGPH